MINKFIGRLIDKATAGSKGRKRFGKRAEIGPQGHAINPALVDERAANVVRTLKEAGYEAYIVGGAVRDLLLGLKPKDFDVATNATPEQVRRSSAAPSSSAGAFASCTWCTAGAASTR